MFQPHLTAHADRPIHLEACNFGSPCLRVLEEPEHEVCAPLGILSLHNAAPNDHAGMGRLMRAVEAFNAIMDGATMVRVYPASDGPAADVMTAGDPLRLANRADCGDIAAALDGRAAEMVGGGL